jgi:hypothetical protein
MKNIFKFVPAVLIICLACLNNVHAQDAAKTMNIRDAVNAQHFTFTAQTAIPLARPSRQLTSEYTVQIKDDSLISDLPYFGAAYLAAPINATESPLHFTSTIYTYDLTEKKRGGWLVVIKPQNAKGVTEMDFTIFDNGSASLVVSSTNRDVISFNGVVAY